MSLRSRSVTVTSGAAIQLSHVAGPDDKAEGMVCMITNTGAAVLYVAGLAAMTIANGTPVEASGGSISFPLRHGDEVWGISAGVDIDVRVLEVGRT